MPGHRSHSLYNIEPLQPLIERGFVLLTPNFRIARRIKTVWNSLALARGAQVWQPLAVAPLESWLEQQWHKAVESGLLSPQVVIGEGLLLELWQQVISEHQRSSGQYTLLRPSAAAELANRARENLIRWQVDLDNANIHQEFILDLDCSSYVAWHNMLSARLKDQGLISPAERIQQLLTVAHKMPQMALALLDFDDIPPLQRACVTAMASSFEQIENVGAKGRRVAHAFADRHSELLAAAQWARQCSLTTPEATVGIILPDMNRDRATLEHLLRREFDVLDADKPLPVNFSAGLRLDRTAIVRDALLALDFCRSTAAVEDTLSLLKSRYISLPDAGSELAVRFIRALFDDGAERLDIGELRYRASQVKLGAVQGLSIGANLMTLSQMRCLRERHAPSVWVQHFSDVLDIWGWPGAGTLDSQEYQQLESWYQMLEEFSAADRVAGSLSLHDALAWLGRCAGRILFQPQTPDSSIQVLGMLEGAGLTFDQLWICGMQANTWPAPARPSPLIPMSLQRKLNMPHATAEREANFAAALMDRYIRSAPEINASYVRSQDGVPELPSALLESFTWLSAGDDSKSLDPRWHAQRKTLALEPFVDGLAPAVGLVEAAKLRGGSGLIEDQSHCPFRAFARRRLQVEPLGEFHTGLSAADRGSILHDALFALWGSLADSVTLAASSDDTLAQCVKESAQAAIGSIPARLQLRLGQAYLALEQSRLQGLLLEWLEVEKEREGFTVYAREQDITLKMPPLEIKLRVDRIDNLADGSQLIIDYKSGRSTANDWLGERPAKPQLLLYAIASKAEASSVGALSFAQVRPRDCKYAGAGKVEAAAGIRTDIAKLVGDKLPAGDWDSLVNAWSDTLEKLVQDFVAGDARVDPLAPASCSYCGLQALCRIGEERESLA